MLALTFIPIGPLGTKASVNFIKYASGGQIRVAPPPTLKAQIGPHNRVKRALKTEDGQDHACL
ncbi:hypothetical protein [Roseovarius sp.]|uniref:hypothetical protein n=1 Tax=Roseovarius sp. TaxID=1486281 RepID=UPI003BA9DC8A